MACFLGFLDRSRWENERQDHLLLVFSTECSALEITEAFPKQCTANSVLRFNRYWHELSYQP